MMHDMAFSTAISNMVKCLNHFSNFGRETPKDNFCEIILKSGHWPWSRCYLKIFLFFSSSGHFIQWSGTISAILEEGHPKNISVKLF